MESGDERTDANHDATERRECFVNVGTTGEPFDARPETAVSESREIGYLIDLVNEVVPPRG